MGNGIFVNIAQGQLHSGQPTFLQPIITEGLLDWQAPAGESLNLRLGDNAGATFLNIEDSDGIVVASIDSNGVAAFGGGAGFSGLITFNAPGAAVTAASYQTGRDSDATNQLHSNVPTGATFEWSVNDVAEMVLSATQLNLQNNSLLVNVINSTDAVATSLLLQSQTFTPGGSHAAVNLTPSWSAEDFGHVGLNFNVTQNGDNADALTGMQFSMTKATALTTLAAMNGLSFQAPSVTGTVTSASAISISSQANANIISSRAIRMLGTGVANSIVWGSSVHQYASAANDMRFMDTTNARGIVHILTAAGVQTITTSGGDLSLDANSGVVVITSARHEYAKGADVASANNLTLGLDGNLFHITGATQINAITTANWQAGSTIFLIFDSTPDVKHNTAGGAGTAVMLLAGNTDFHATANTVLQLIFDGTSWYEVPKRN